jgi:hypothetical protein
MTITTSPRPRATRASTGKVWTAAAIRDLGARTDVQTAGAILGIGRSKAYALARTDGFPVRLIRVGRRYVVPVSGILDLLGVTE